MNPELFENYKLFYDTLERTPIQPMYDQILVDIIPAPKEISGIILPDSAEQVNQKRFAKVIEVGTGRMMSNGTYFLLMVQPGDYVELNPNYTYEERPYGDTILYLCREADVRGIVRMPDREAELKERLQKHFERFGVK